MKKLVALMLALCLLLSACAPKQLGSASPAPDLPEPSSPEELMDICLGLVGTSEYQKMIKYYPLALELESFDGLITDKALVRALPLIPLLQCQGTDEELIERYHKNPRYYHYQLMAYFVVQAWFAYIRLESYDELRENFWPLYINLLPTDMYGIAASQFKNALSPAISYSREGIEILIELFAEYCFKTPPLMRSNMSIVFEISNCKAMMALCYRYLGENEKAETFFAESEALISDYTAALSKAE